MSGEENGGVSISKSEHAALVECAKALEAVIAATQAYLPPDGISAKDCISRILSASDNPNIVSALLARGTE